MKKKKSNSKCGKTQIVTKLKNLNQDKTQKLRFWGNSETQIVTKLELSKISIYEEKKLEKGLLERTFWHLDNRWDVL